MNKATQRNAAHSDAASSAANAMNDQADRMKGVVGGCITASFDMSVFVM